jgi:hypothetical protein
MRGNVKPFAVPIVIRVVPTVPQMTAPQERLLRE